MGRASSSRLRDLLSRLEQYDRVKTIVLAIAVVLPILAIIVFPYYEPWDPPVELRGRVVGLYQWPSKVEASPTRFIVELEEGRRVYVYGTEHLLFRTGQPVIVAQRRSRFLRREEHTLVRLLPFPEEVERPLFMN